MAMFEILKKLLKLAILTLGEELWETMKKLGFDTFAIISLFLVKYKTGSIQNLVTAFWFVEDLCTGSSLTEMAKLLIQMRTAWIHSVWGLFKDELMLEQVVTEFFFVLGIFGR